MSEYKARNEQSHSEELVPLGPGEPHRTAKNMRDIMENPAKYAHCGWLLALGDLESNVIGTALQSNVEESSAQHK